MFVTTMPRIVELAGLPGSGKTAVASLLAERFDSITQSLAHRHLGRVRRLGFDKLFLPVTVIRFGNVFHRIHSSGDSSQNPPYSLWVARLLMRVTMASRSGAKAFHSPAESILVLLNEMSVEHTLARIEARIHGKNLILDEGYVQRGIGVWMRAPDEVRTELWETYVSCIPKGTTCAVLECEPSEALRRAESRSRGVCAVTKWMPGANVDSSALGQRYRDLAGLLVGPSLSDRVTFMQADATEPVEEVADSISTALEPLDARRQWVVSVRN